MHYIKEMTNYIPILIVILLVLLFLQNTNTRHQYSYRQEVPITQSLPPRPQTLQDIYREIHNLEAIARLEIDSTNEGSGGSHGTSRNRFIMERLSMRISYLKDLADQYISRKPVRINNISPIHYYNTPEDHDGSKFLGIPSVPGSIHTYHNPEILYRMPQEHNFVENMLLV